MPRRNAVRLFFDSMFSNENPMIFKCEAFRRRSTAVGLRLLYHILKQSTICTVHHIKIPSTFVNGILGTDTQNRIGLKA